MPRSMICVEAQMGRPSTWPHTDGQEVHSEAQRRASHTASRGHPRTLSSAAWVHVSRAEKRSVSTPVCPGAGPGENAEWLWV